MKIAGEKESILIVDAGYSTCESLKLVFEKGGYEVETAARSATWRPAAAHE